MFLSLGCFFDLSPLIALAYWGWYPERSPRVSSPSAVLPSSVSGLVLCSLVSRWSS